MKKVLIIILIITLVGGCKTLVDVKKTDQLLSYDIAFEKSYIAGQDNIKYVGEDLLSIQKVEVSEFNSYITTEKFNYPMYISKGEYFNVWGRTPHGDIVVNRDLNERIWEQNRKNGLYLGLNETGLEVNSDGIILKSICLSDQPYYYNDLGNYPPKTKVFEKKNQIVKKPSEYEFKVVYQGISNNIIKLQYEEYVNNLAREAFFKTFEYDLNSGKEIAIKGVLIEIIEANNSTIKYIVKDDSNIYKWVK